LEITIVKPDMEHTPGIARVCSEGWRQTVEGKLSQEYQKKNTAFWYNHDRVQTDILQGLYSYVALNGREVVGVIGGSVTEDATGEIFVLYVDEAYRYKGIGRMLLEKITNDHQEKGIKRQWVSVQEDNQRGIPFYKARGFVYQDRRARQTDTDEEQVSLRFLRKI